MDVAELLAGNSYPGRGLLVCRTRDRRLGMIYWLSGRSQASKERHFVADGVNLQVMPTAETTFDPLRHYRAARQSDRWLVLGNGDQVDAIGAELDGGVDFLSALRKQRFEPDAPIRTPRIAACIDLAGGSLVVGCARYSPAAAGEVEHVSLAVDGLGPGWGIAATVYRTSGNEPEAWGVPVTVAVGQDLPAELRKAWQSLPEAVRIQAAGRTADSPSWRFEG